MKILFQLVFTLAACSISNAQRGHYFVTNFTPSDERIDYITYGMAQDDRGVLFFANKSGVLMFDGRNWNLIDTPGPVYTLTTFGSQVFVGGYNGFGRLNYGTDNTWTFQSLSTATKEPMQIFASATDQKRVYFLAEEQLFSMPVAGGEAKLFATAPKPGLFTGLFATPRGVYVNSTTGLLKIEGTTLKPAELTLPAGQTILLMNPLAGQDKVMIATEQGKIFLWEGERPIELVLKDARAIQRDVLVNGCWVNENLLALGTLRGGVWFVNARTGSTEEVADFQTGLPDNEIYAVLRDRDFGIWAAHDYGFSRIAPSIPFKSYHHYAGLSGNLLCADVSASKVYVGTTLGLFCLQEDQSAQRASTGGAVDDVPENPRKRGLFSFLRKHETTPAVLAAEDNKPKASKPRMPVARTAASYSYRKVAGIDGKINQLVHVNGKLLAAGTAGLYEVNSLQASALLTAPVRAVFWSPSLDQLLVSTLNEDILTFQRSPRGWQQTHLLDSLRDDVSYIFEDKVENIWLCARTHLYKVETVDGGVIGVEAVPFDNPSVDESLGLALGTEVYATANGTFNRYNSARKRFEKFDSLPGPKRYFASGGYFWFYDGHRWRSVGQRAGKGTRLEWLSLFHNIRFITPVQREEGLWVITAANELFKFAPAAGGELVNYPLFLREVRSQQSKLPPSKMVEVSQLESTVTFEFIQPDYYSTKAVEYRYFVKGISKRWSDWSSNNIVSFSYLPTGSYTLQVQTRDLMGKISNGEQIQLKVDPPYWKQSWFYALEAVFFGALVFFSMRLGSLSTRYQFVSRLLSLLTVIMLIQFIQTVVVSLIEWRSTPVIEFFIQVIIALLVLPLEGFLRKLFVRSSERHLQHQFEGNN